MSSEPGTARDESQQPIWSTATALVLRRGKVTVRARRKTEFLQQVPFIGQMASAMRANCTRPADRL